MEHFLLFLCCAVFLLAASTAHAYAIYNDSDHGVCVQTTWSHDWGNCKFWIDSGSHHNGEKGSSLSNVWFQWWTDKVCYTTTVPANIPDGGYAKVHDDTVKVYKHDGTFLGGYPFTTHSCD